MNRIVVLIKRPQRVSSPLPPCEGTVTGWPTMNQEEGSRRTQPGGAGPLISDFQPPAP